ncbi:MAG: hypothetical protein H5T98_02180 [Syntrophomonadaceae bacterium]|nr:hypothetical protein [Syntrophomonadaceae bacterium]
MKTSVREDTTAHRSCISLVILVLFKKKGGIDVADNSDIIMVEIFRGPQAAGGCMG